MTRRNVNRDALDDETGARRDVLALAVMAFAVRLAWVRWGAWTGGDTPEYLLLARNLVFHHIFSMSQNTEALLLPTAHRPPLYSFLIAALWWRDAAPTNLVLLIQAVLGALTVALVYAIARDAFSRTVAIVSGLGMLFAPMSCHYTAVILTETVFTFFVVLGVFLWGRKRFASAGVAFGLAMLTRPTLLPFLLGLPLLSLLPAWRPHLRAHLLIIVAAFAISSVWIIRNAIVFQRFVPIAASGWGTNLLFGTMEIKLAGDDVWTTVLNDPVLKLDAGSNETQADQLRMRRAIERIVNDPGGWLVARAKQYPRLFIDSGDYLLGSYNMMIGEALRESRFLVVLVKAAFVLGNLGVFALALFGLFVARARFAELSHITLFPVFLLAAHLPMWIESRYSLPMMPLVIILAAGGALKLAAMVSAAYGNETILAGRLTEVR